MRKSQTYALQVQGLGREHRDYILGFMVSVLGFTYKV